MDRRLIATIAALSIAGTACAQDSLTTHLPTPESTAGNSGWITRHDVRGAGFSFLAIGLLSLADKSVAKATQRPSLQSSAALRNSTKAIQSAGDPGALLLSSGLYVAGKLTHHSALATASKHSVMSIVVSSVFTQSLKLSAGRARPNVTNEQNPYVFHLFHGAKTDYNSLPSGHTTAAFAAAGAFSSELVRSHPKAGRVVRPVLYGIATLVGGSRMYNNRHWLSDVATGALLGEVTARRIVQHSQNRKPERACTSC